MNNVHEDQPVVFQSRWALSYLGGPLGRDKIQQLMASRKAAAAARAPPASALPGAASAAAGAATAAAPMSVAASRPALPPGISQFFLATSVKRPAGSQLLYRPAVLGSARMHFSQTSAHVDTWQTPEMLLTVDGEAEKLVWDDASRLAKAPDLDKDPDAGGTFDALPATLARPKTYSELESGLKEMLYRTSKVQVWKCKSLGQFSAADETEETFRTRLTEQSRQQCDAEIAKLKTKHDSAIASLNEKRRKAEQTVEKQKSQFYQQLQQTVIRIFQAILAAIGSRKLTSAANVQRMGTSINAASKISKEHSDVQHASETLASIDQQIEAANADFEDQCTRQKALVDAIPLEAISVQPKKSDISVTRVILVWTPYAVAADGNHTPLFGEAAAG